MFKPAAFLIAEIPSAQSDQNQAFLSARWVPLRFSRRLGHCEDDTGSFGALPEEMSIAVPAALDLALTAGLRLYDIAASSLAAVAA
jgi:hypothetical protein